MKLDELAKTNPDAETEADALWDQTLRADVKNGVIDELTSRLQRDYEEQKTEAL